MVSWKLKIGNLKFKDERPEFTSLFFQYKIFNFQFSINSGEGARLPRRDVQLRNKLYVGNLLDFPGVLVLIVL